MLGAILCIVEFDDAKLRFRSCNQCFRYGKSHAFYPEKLRFCYSKVRFLPRKAALSVGCRRHSHVLFEELSEERLVREVQVFGYFLY